MYILLVYFSALQILKYMKNISRSATDCQVSIATAVFYYLLLRILLDVSNNLLLGLWFKIWLVTDNFELMRTLTWSLIFDLSLLI